LHFGCFDDKTEILTENGFKLFKDLDKNEKVATLNRTGELEYQKPTNYMEYSYNGKLMCAKGLQVNYAVTPNHQLYTGTFDDKNYKINIASNIYKKRFRIKKNAYWQGKEKKFFWLGSRKIFMDDWLKFLGFWLAEGWITKNKFKQKSGNLTNCMQVGVVQKKDTKELDVLDTAMTYAGFNVKRDDRGQLRIFNKRLWKYLRPLGGASEKYIPKEIKKLSPRQLKILLDWYLIGDGNIDKNGRIRATTTSKKLVDDLTEIALKIGWSANFYKKKKRDTIIEGRFIPKSRQKPCYTVAFLRNTGKKNCLRTKVFPKHQFKKNYKGKIYDVEVPNHTLTTHFISLQNKEFEDGIDKIFKEYPNVTLKTIGAFIPKFKNKWGRRYEHGFGHQDVYKWIKNKFPGYMDEADIIVAPLEVNVYNRAKSSIKFLESGSAKKPGVWQDIRQYQSVVNHGENGFLAERANGWYKAIKKLIEDKKLRKTMGENAFKTVEKNWQIDSHIQDYAVLPRST